MYTYPVHISSMYICMSSTSHTYNGQTSQSHLDPPTSNRPEELTCSAQRAMCAGVSSFGFGGTNSRADLWADVEKGPFKAPVGGVRLRHLEMGSLMFGNVLATFYGDTFGEYHTYIYIYIFIYINIYIYIHIWNICIDGACLWEKIELNMGKVRNR